MQKFKNIPTINVDIQDGNLRLDRPITGNVCLVVGRATQGRSDTQYFVTDTNVAASVFGSTSPLIQKMSEVMVGGAKNIILYRIGGAAAEIRGLFGADSIIKTTRETADAGLVYKVYIGPNPATGIGTVLIAFRDGRIVYSNVPGGIVDSGEIQVAGFDASFPYTIGTPTSPVLFSDAVNSAIVQNLAATTPIVGFAPVYTAGADNMDCGWKKLYELVDTALERLETTIATRIFVEGIILDAPNIADGSTDPDALTYVRREEIDGVFEYTWSADKLVYHSGNGTTETIDPLLADVDSNGQPIVKFRYNEVNFAHRLGSWCFSMVENEGFAIGAIGTSMPAIYSTYGISKWAGMLPTTDQEGNIIANGSGLLGNRFMAGEVGNLGGLFATDSGYPDGNVLVDGNNSPVDVGKFISVVPAIISLPSSGMNGTVSGLRNGAAVYAGMLTALTASGTTTNATMPLATSGISLRKSKLDEFLGAHYVMVTQKAKGCVVLSGELAANAMSDFRYVSTIIAVGDIVSAIREGLDSLLGQGFNDILLSAADTKVQSILKNRVEVVKSIAKYAYSVVPDPIVNGRASIRIPLTLVPKFELREINIPVKLGYDV